MCVPVLCADPLLLLSRSQFRERVRDILPALPAQHDHYLLRWLRGERPGLYSHNVNPNHSPPLARLIDGQLLLRWVYHGLLR